MRPIFDAFYIRIILAIGLAQDVAACASSVNKNDSFRQIQEQEAIVAEARNRCDSEKACRAANALCDIASSVDDDDATTRCSQAKRSCVVLRQRKTHCR
ncbi:MAG: hypothetical protein IPJ88_12615 [Myxococcales bacterium]|nr:MAG: hypothetical protein IPJ88_12615 [Myxococcales bacterium]